jgi:hypothetical protein
MKLLQYIDKILDNHKLNIFNWLFIILYVLYVITFFGIWYVNPNYIQIITVIMQVYIAAFLMIRFNPFIKHELRQYDDRLIFASGFLLLTNAGVTSLFLKYAAIPVYNVV